MFFRPFNLLLLKKFPLKVLNHNRVLLSNAVCESWLALWEKCSGLNADFCSAKHCRNKELEGVHVKCVNNMEEIHYIIPLCKASHAIASEIDIYEGTRLIVSEKDWTLEVSPGS